MPKRRKLLAGTGILASASSELPFKTRAEAIRRIFEYIEIWYNRQRIHAAIGYRTPDEVEYLYFENRLTGASASGDSTDEASA
ncbi:IS3 family transposase [Alicyclobacillus acidocaldarius]|uniref:IS3 family transposase n=1 Tax=Alicyclobacillus acidocaldarius TaxID=405212 RepID=UPI0009DA6FDB